MPFVLDASVALAWCFRDEENEFAHGVLRRLNDDSAVAPAIWLLEVANGLVIAQRRGRLAPADVFRAVDLIRGLPVDLEQPHSERVLGPVLELAESHRLSMYDASYIELARRGGYPLATQDRALAAVARSLALHLID